MASNRRRSKKTAGRRTSSLAGKPPKPTRPDSPRSRSGLGDRVWRDVRSPSTPRKVAFIPDVHVPNHDPRAWKLMLKVLDAFRPETIIILGDFAEFEPVSAHPRKPRSERFLTADLVPIASALAELESVGALHKIYVMGNHESRLERYIAKNAPALDGLFSYDAWVQDLGWETVPYLETYKLGKLNITHDTGTAGMNAHRDAAADHMGSTIIGHTHRMSYEVRGKVDGVPYLAAMFGWLGKADKVTYLHNAKAAHWVHGFGIGYTFPDGVTHVQPVPIIGGRCVVEGRVYSLK